MAERSRLEGEGDRGGAGLSPSASMFPVRTCVHAGRRRAGAGGFGWDWSGSHDPLFLVCLGLVYVFELL
jgi:hypothetical protein